MKHTIRATCSAAVAAAALLALFQFPSGGALADGGKLKLLATTTDVREIATELVEEGLAAADVDGDGRLELVAGQSWYRPPARPGARFSNCYFNLS